MFSVTNVCNIQMSIAMAFELYTAIEKFVTVFLCVRVALFTYKNNIFAVSYNR